MQTLSREAWTRLSRFSLDDWRDIAVAGVLWFMLIQHGLWTRIAGDALAASPGLLLAVQIIFYAVILPPLGITSVLLIKHYRPAFAKVPLSLDEGFLLVFGVGLWLFIIFYMPYPGAYFPFSLAELVLGPTVTGLVWYLSPPLAVAVVFYAHRRSRRLGKVLLKRLPKIPF